MEGSPAAVSEKVEHMRSRRPTGISSPAPPCTRHRSRWTAPNGQHLDLPVTLDIINISPDGAGDWRARDG